MEILTDSKCVTQYTLIHNLHHRGSSGFNLNTVGRVSVFVSKLNDSNLYKLTNSIYINGYETKILRSCHVHPLEFMVIITAFDIVHCLLTYVI